MSLLTNVHCFGSHMAKPCASLLNSPKAMGIALGTWGFNAIAILSGLQS